MWRDDAFLLDMLLAIRKILDYAAEHDLPTFSDDSLTQDAIIRQFTVLGEASNRISSEFRSQHSEIPWKEIIGFRNVVVHNYFEINIEEVWRIIQEDLPGLCPLLEQLVPPEET